MCTSFLWVCFMWCLTYLLISVFLVVPILRFKEKKEWTCFLLETNILISDLLMQGWYFMLAFYITIKEETVFKRRSVEAIIQFRSSCSCLLAVKLDKEETVFEVTRQDQQKASWQKSATLEGAIAPLCKTLLGCYPAYCSEEIQVREPQNSLLSLSVSVYIYLDKYRCMLLHLFSTKSRESIRKCSF